MAENTCVPQKDLRRALTRTKGVSCEGGAVSVSRGPTLTGQEAPVGGGNSPAHSVSRPQRLGSAVLHCLLEFAQTHVR